MLSSAEAVRQSLGLHLFFIRIMKEHSFFLEIGFTQKDKDLMHQANAFRVGFDKLLAETVTLSNGVVSPSILQSGEVVTPFTLKAEKKSSYFTGVDIDTKLTETELGLRGSNTIVCNAILERRVSKLNNKVMELVTDLISFKTQILSSVLSCNIFTGNYPALIEHIIEEAKLYLSLVQKLQKCEEIMAIQGACAQEAFWSHVMSDHAKVIRGLLDPSEEQLIAGAECFGNEFDALTTQLEETMKQGTSTMQVTNEIISATEGIQDFKQQTIQGILECEIKSIIIPLLADHVLREANHYLRLLGTYKETCT